MKQCIFIDNFRGFSNTYIQLADVNFLVGENSTGKTSVLGLLKLLSSSTFFFMGQDFFADKDVTFGNFADMVSVHAEDRSYFRVGIIKEHPGDNKSGPAVNAVLLTFRERGGVPRLSQLTCTVAGRSAHLCFNGKRTLYKSSDLPSDMTVRDLVDTIMPSWINEHRTEGHGYRTLSIPKGVPEGPLPIFVMLICALQPPREQKPQSKNAKPRSVRS